MYACYIFNKRDQEANKTIDAYIAILRTLAKTCKYEMILDLIVLGIRVNSTRKELLQRQSFIDVKSVP